MQIRVLSALAVAAAVLAGGAARADYQFTFADGSGNFTNNFNIGPGTTAVNIQVYLTQTSTGTDATGLTASGLNSGGVQLTTNDTTVAKVTGVAANDTAHGGTFDAVNTFTSTGGASGSPAVLAVGFSSPSQGQAPTATAPASYLPTAASGANSVYLGTFTFSGLSSGTTFTVSAAPAAGDTNILANGTVIDGLINGSTATITVVVPEPGTMALTGLLASGVAGAAWRRRRRAAAVNG